MQAQVFVQLELFNDPKARKYTIGDKITYKSTYSADEWQTGKIEQILIKDKALQLNNDLISLDQMTDFMLYRPTAKYFGVTFQTFGGIWTLYGAFSYSNDPNVTSLGEWLGVGLGSYALGWVLRRFVYKVPVKLNDKNRMRIVDLRMVVPEE